MEVSEYINSLALGTAPFMLHIESVNMKGQPKKVKCPVCDKKGDWFSGQYGPFCSRRCKLVDLGKWLGEEHRISEPLRPGHFQPYEELPPGQDPDTAEPER